MDDAGETTGDGGWGVRTKLFTNDFLDGFVYLALNKACMGWSRHVIISFQWT